MWGLDCAWAAAPSGRAAKVAGYSDIPGDGAGRQDAMPLGGPVDRLVKSISEQKVKALLS
jgi:hypothetical protein